MFNFGGRMNQRRNDWLTILNLAVRYVATTQGLTG
jgi:hypothetical protein